VDTIWVFAWCETVNTIFSVVKSFDSGDVTVALLLKWPGILKT
jgi:hypothetical protein